jgi:uncharacterized membrane protein YjgN (DUF898 family)
VAQTPVICLVFTKLIKKGWAFKAKSTSQEGVRMSFIFDITTILKVLMNIIEIIVNYYDLYDDLPTNIVVTSQFAHSLNQGN